MGKLDILDDASEIVHYNEVGIPLYIVKSDLKHFLNKSALCHWHDDIEILYVLEGHMSYNVNGTIVTLTTGDAIVVNSKQLHYGFSTDGTDCIYYCYVFKPELLFANEILYERYVTPILLSQDISCTVFSSKETKHEKILQLFPTIYQLQEKQELGYELKILSVLQQFWSLWYQFLYPQLKNLNEQVDQNIQIQKQMVLYVHKNYQKKLQIQDIAKAGNISRTKCCQIFKKYFRTTPIEYLNHYRLEKSCKLLAQSEKTVTEIALSCGFNSSSYFTETFRKQKGCRPKEYRKRTSSNQIS